LLGVAPALPESLRDGAEVRGMVLELRELDGVGDRDSAGIDRRPNIVGEVEQREPLRDVPCNRLTFAASCRCVRPNSSISLR
jgi:hypothetical protein